MDKNELGLTKKKIQNKAESHFSFQGDFTMFQRMHDPAYLDREKWNLLIFNFLSELTVRACIVIACKSLKPARVCKSLQEPARVCKNLQEPARAYKSLHESARACTSLQLAIT